MFGEEQDVTEDIGHFFVKIFGDLLFGFVFLASPASHHEVTLGELAHFLLQLEEIPVGVATNAKFFGVDVGDFFDLASDLGDVHEGIISPNLTYDL